MKTNEYKLLFKMFIISVLLYALHKLVFCQVLLQSDADFIYSINLLYGFFFLASVLISVVLLAVNKKNINNVGFTFLFLTVLKMGIAFFFLRPILSSTSSLMTLEKKNFLVIFLVFLAMETLVAVKILNNKQ